ncbi:MAG: TonB family protein [Vicinamibacterales bacterium]
MTGLFIFTAAVALAQPAPNQHATEIAKLEARVTSGEAQCPDYQQLARFYRDRGDFDLGLTTVRTCTTLAPDDPRAYVAVADYLNEEANALRARALKLEWGAGVPAGSSPLDCRSARASLPVGPSPVRVGGNVRPPTRIKHVNPIFPDVARQARVQGVVILEVTVGTYGEVTGACVLRSIPTLDQAAVDAVRQWEFEPTLLNGQPVPVIMTVTVNFSLM